MEKVLCKLSDKLYQSIDFLFFCGLIFIPFVVSQGCDEADSSSGLVRRSSLHNLMVPDKVSSLDKEKESWKNMYGHSPSSLYHSKSEDCVDLNVTQIINLKKLTSKPRKIKHKEPTKSKLILPSIHEKHNTVHVCRSPVILSRKSRFKQVQIRGSNPLFGESGKPNWITFL